MTYKGKTIKKHIRGNWYARIRHNGKVIAVYGRTQAEAYEKLKVIADKVEIERLKGKLQKLESIIPTTAHTVTAQPQIKTAKTYTLKEWFDEWLNSYKVGNVRANTIYQFKKAVPNLQELYNVDIRGITNLMIAKAVNEVSGTRMKDKVHNLLRQMFTVAFNNRLVDSNPTLTIPKPKQFAKFTKKVFTPEQESKFIQLCLANLDKYEPLLICLLQGLRKGEMLALRPNDLDFDRNTLRVDESYDHEFPQDLQTKNAASNRTMPMFALTRELLYKYKDHEPTKRIYEDVNPSTLIQRLLKLLKQNGLPRLTIHELRHTFITRCHEKAIDEIIVQKWVGHAKGSRMTKAIYTHVGDEQERKYIDQMNKPA